MPEGINSKEILVRSTSCLLAFLLTLIMTPDAIGQLVATKDLVSDPVKPTPTQPAASDGAVSQDGDCFIDHRDGAVVSEVREKLRLEIVTADPRLIYDKVPVVVKVRLKNEGDQPILVPWETEHVEPVKTSPSDETSYENAEIRVTLRTQEKRGGGTFLKGGAVLEALPGNYQQHVQLLPGQWVEVKFRALVECLYNTDWGCPAFKADEHAQLTAHWSEWLFTHKGEGCKSVTGAYTSRKLDSDPVEIIYASIPKQQDSDPSSRTEVLR